MPPQGQSELQLGKDGQVHWFPMQLLVDGQLQATALPQLSVTDGQLLPQGGAFASWHIPVLQQLLLGHDPAPQMSVALVAVGETCPSLGAPL